MSNHGTYNEAMSALLDLVNQSKTLGEYHHRLGRLRDELMREDERSEIRDDPVTAMVAALYDRLAIIMVGIAPRIQRDGIARELSHGARE